jgi:hypothetical protein
MRTAVLIVAIGALMFAGMAAAEDPRPKASTPLEVKKKKEGFTLPSSEGPKKPPPPGEDVGLDPRYGTDRIIEQPVGEIVECPFAEVQSEVTTRMFAPWWATPQIGALESVHVVDVAGEPSLICNYRAFSATLPVARHVPKAFTSCVAQGTHFLCR